MLVKSQYHLQPSVYEAHSVIIEDSEGHIIYIAVQAGDEIVTAQAGDSNFEELLQAFGVHKTTIVHSITPKPLSEMKRLL